MNYWAEITSTRIATIVESLDRREKCIVSIFRYWWVLLIQQDEQTWVCSICRLPVLRRIASLQIKANFYLNDLAWGPSYRSIEQKTPTFKHSSGEALLTVSWTKLETVGSRARTWFCSLYQSLLRYKQRIGCSHNLQACRHLYTTRCDVKHWTDSDVSRNYATYRCHFERMFNAQNELTRNIVHLR